MPTPELSWSVFHASEPDVDMLKSHLAKADTYGVVSIEADGGGTIDGCLLFPDYPEVSALRNRDEVMAARETLNQVVELVHASGRKIIKWHREVMVPAGMENLDGLMDEKGEIDFNGTVFWNVVRNKLREFFMVVPGMDGIVLTLTESDYSVIHSSQPDRYPPTEIADRMIRVFHEELTQRGKSLTFRTFGSIDKDYSALTRAADEALKSAAFEIESKVTRADWGLVLPQNPWLKKRDGAAMAVEYDLLGEFFGQGEIPCGIPDLLLAQLSHGRECGCDRVSARVDRVGRVFTGSFNEINVYAFSRGVEEPSVTGDRIWEEWADMHWGPKGRSIIPAMKASMDMVLKSHYVDGHMLAQGPMPSLDHTMLGGSMALFHEGAPQSVNVDMWSILSEKNAPTHAEVIEEKDEAVAIADRGLKAVLDLGDALPEPTRGVLRDAWEKAAVTTRMYRAAVAVIIAYVRDMAALKHEPDTLAQAIRESLDIADIAIDRYGASASVIGNVPSLVAQVGETLKANAGLFRTHYAAEFRARKQWASVEGVIDFAICGGITDEWRLKRYMHSSGVAIEEGVPMRLVANAVFPNGFLEYRLRTEPGRKNELLIQLHAPGGGVRVVLDGKSTVVEPASSTGLETVCVPITGTSRCEVRVRLEKPAKRLPQVAAVGVRVAG